MTLNRVEAVNSGSISNEAQNLKAENSFLKASIFDYKIENTKNNGDIFLSKDNDTHNKQTFDWADTPNSLKHASLKEQLKNIEKENKTGFFSNLKDFIMNFGDINPEEIYF